MASANNSHFQNVAVIGGGPAGLMAAEILLQGNPNVCLYESKPSVGRKFLIAGKGGLNLTHSETREQFLDRYGARRAWLEPMFEHFGPTELRNWALELGIQTFVGSSGRVFPNGMKAAPLLYAWRKRLTASGLTLLTQHTWLGWGSDNSLRFETPTEEKLIPVDAVILALGGASWPQTGSTGMWSSILAGRGVQLVPFKPANCGFDVNWSEHFRTKFNGQPLKAVTLSFGASNQPVIKRQGEFIITTHGVEGSLIYALSAPIRDEIAANGSAIINLDLAPNWELEHLVERLSQPRGSRSFASHLEKATGLKGVKAGLLWEFVPKHDFSNVQKLANYIKNLQIPLCASRPLAESISTAGGVSFESLDEHLMLKTIPGVFCAGEMLDWEAPTGGYLMTACFATGRAAGLGALAWLKNQTVLQHKL